VPVVPRQPVAGGEDQPGLLGGGDAGGGATIVGAAAQSDFDEDHCCSVVADQIYLAAAHAEVAFDHAQSPFAQKTGGQIFGDGTLGLRGRHGGRTMTPMNTMDRTAALYVVATPIGNLADITLRALEVLRAADLVACEDTRHARRLLDHHGVRAATLSLHEHNEAAAAQKLVAALREGKRVALISDAGTPGISDPGARACAAVRAAGFAVVPLPGANAAIAALSAAGLADARFVFAGFLSPKPTARRGEIEHLKAVPAALVFYEAPHRIEETLADLAAVLEPERILVVARELTKVFEEIAVMPLPEGPDWLAADANRRRGEFVVAVSAPPARQGLDGETERVLRLLLDELPLKQAAKLTAAITGQPRNALYERALALKGG
jgi:16S rRNA (cytidine1402-2'-O)-methyltransferase